MSKELTELQQTFLDALFGEARGDLKKAKEIAGYAPVSPIASIIHGIREHIIDRAQTIIARNAARAAFNIEDVVQGTLEDTPISKTQVEISKDLLDRVGISKRENITISAGAGDGTGAIFILPTKSSSKTE